MVRGMVDRGKIGFGVLSWRGYDSLANSLESYERQRLLDLFDEKVLFLPEAGLRGIELARRYGLQEKTTPNNLGILGGFKALASAGSPNITAGMRDFTPSSVASFWVLPCWHFSGMSNRADKLMPTRISHINFRNQCY